MSIEPNHTSKLLTIKYISSFASTKITYTVMFVSTATNVTNKIFKDRIGGEAVLTANEAQGIFVTKFHVIYHQTVQEALGQ